MDAAGLDSSEAAAKVKYWQGVQKDFIVQTDLKRQYGRENIGIPVEKLSERAITPSNEDIVSQMSPEKVSQYNWKLSNRAVRKWYMAHDESIPSLIDKSLPLEEQARQACDLCSAYRTQARDLMRDQDARGVLNKE